MAITPLPDSANLENLRKRAKALLKSVHAGDAAALEQVGPYFGNPRTISLQQAHLVLARQYGFSSWTKLKRHIEGANPSRETGEQRANRFLDLVTVAYDQVPDIGPKRFAAAADLLNAHPEIRQASIYTAAAIGDAGQIDRWLDKDSGLLNRKGGYFNWEPLMYAAYARLPGASSLAAGLRLLERGADPNAYYMWSGKYKFTALTGVLGEGENGPINQPVHPDWEVFARALLERGADPNDSQGAYNRCFEPDNRWLELLLEYGLKPTDRNNWLHQEGDDLVPNPEETMHFQLIQAIHRGNVERARLLIDHGVHIDRPDDTYDTRTKGKTPYQAAMLLGQEAIAKALLDAGAKAETLSDGARFQSACMTGHRDAARALLQANPDLLSTVRQSEMLNSAVHQRNLAALETMIAIGFELNPANGNTPLHQAAYNGDLEIARLLLAAGADPTIRDPHYHAPPIGFAEHARRDDMVALLDTLEMDIFCAAARGKLEQIDKRLSEDPTRLNMRFGTLWTGSEPRDNDWMTPLVFAVVNNSEDAVRTLLDRGADATVADGAGNSVKTVAEKHANERIVSILAG